MSTYVMDTVGGDLFRELLDEKNKNFRNEGLFHNKKTLATRYTRSHKNVVDVRQIRRRSPTFLQVTGPF